MADEETQGLEDTSWWAVDAFSDSPPPATSFDEPLVWPEALHPDQPPATEPAPRPDASIDDDAGAMPAAPPAPVSDATWQPALDEHPVADPGPLAGLGGGTADRPSDPPVEPPAPPADLDDLLMLGVTGLGHWPGWDDLDAGDPPPGSIWADEAPAVPAGNMLVTSTMAAPAVYATADGAPGGRRWPRVNVRPGNAAVIAMISLASLVLLGMFLSVRARNEVPTDASQTRTPGDGIAVTTPLNTVPLTTTVPTVPPPPAINLADLIPAPPAAASDGTATTTATTPPTTPSAGASTATTRPAPQTTVTTVTTAAPEAPEATPEPTTPPVTSPPVDDTRPTVTTRPAPPTTTFTWPDIPGTSIPIPTLPQRRGIAGFSGMPNDD